MRLWHKNLVEVLPDKMLVAQWRELSAIVGSINKNGTPNHRLVNVVLDYDLSHFAAYADLIYKEMIKRKMNPTKGVYDKIFNYTGNKKVSFDDLYNNWHNERYFRQCYYNLEEKFDRGIVSQEEWFKIENKKER